MTSGCAWPRIIGPQEQTRSTYSLPSTSVRYAPRPLAMKRGVPPTARKARTGLFTPPGVTASARAKRAAEAVGSRVAGTAVVVVTSGGTQPLSPRPEGDD